MDEGFPKWDKRNTNERRLLLSTPQLLSQVRTNLRKIVKDVRLHHLWPDLMQHDVLGRETKNEIQSDSTHEEMVLRIFNYLERQPCWRFHGFLRVLYLDDQQDIINLFGLDPESYKDSKSKEVHIARNHPLTIFTPSDLEDMKTIYESQSEDAAYEYGKRNLQDIVKVVNNRTVIMHAPTSIRDLLYTLKHHPTFHTLWLIKVNHDVGSVRTVAEFANESKTLQELSLNDRTIDEECLEVLENTFKENCGLQTLYIGHGVIGHKGMTSITNVLAKCTGLQFFGLNPYDLNDDQTEQLLDGLGSHPLLKGIYFSSERLTNRGVSHFARNLKQNSMLEVQLMSNGMTDEGAQELASALQESEILEFVGLWSNQMTDRTVKQMADALLTNRSLTYLELLIGSFSDEAANSILEVLKVNTNVSMNLCALSLSDCSDTLKEELQTYDKVKLRHWLGM